LWEGHWILSAERLQQWDVLYDFAKGEGNQELMLECAWRIKDWNENKDSLEEQINQLPEIPTPHRSCHPLLEGTPFSGTSGRTTTLASKRHVLYDFAKGEGNPELMLECAWRIKDWNENKDSLEEQINQLPEIPTPHRSCHPSP